MPGEGELYLRMGELDSPSQETLMSKKRLALRSGLALVVAFVGSVTMSCAVAVHDSGPDKVLVCHKGKNTLSVSSSALQAHLGHGDYRGACR